MAIKADIRDYTILSKGMFDLLTQGLPEASGRILIVDAEQFEPYLPKIIKDVESCKFVLHSANEVYRLALQEQFTGKQNVRIVNFDIFGRVFTNERFDRIIAAPESKSAIGFVNESESLIEQMEPRPINTEIATLFNMLACLSDDGELDFLAGGTTTMNSVGMDLRNYILDYYQLIELDELEYNEGTPRRVRKTIIKIKKGITDDVLVKRYSMGSISTRKTRSDAYVKKSRTKSVSTRGFYGSRPIGEFYPDITHIKNAPTEKTSLTLEKTFSSSAMEGIIGWSVNKLELSTDSELLDYVNSKVPKKELRYVSDISRGRRISEKNENGRFAVLSVGNIGKYEIDYGAISRIDVEDEFRIQKYILCDGDILMTARGTEIRCAIFHWQRDEYIAAENLIIIRPDRNVINSVYLKLFFDSAIGQKMIASLVNDESTSSLLLNAVDIENMLIPMLNKKEQEEIAMNFEMEYRHYKHELSHIEDRWDHELQNLMNVYKFK